MISMKMNFPLFKQLHIETHSNCNRECKTCLRQNTHGRWKDGEKINEYMSSDMVFKIIDDASNIPEFDGKICLQYFNEPFMDERLRTFGKYAKDKGFKTFVNTNGDFITPDIAKKIDGNLDYINISLYDYIHKDILTYTKERADFVKRIKEIRKLFEKTVCVFSTIKHLTTHFSPRKEDLKKRIRDNIDKPCTICCQYRLVIDYKGDMRVCCEDINNIFGMGNINNHSLLELWYDEKHQTIVKDLMEEGGRSKYSYCSICPLGSGVEKTILKKVRGRSGWCPDYFCKKCNEMHELGSKIASQHWEHRESKDGNDSQ